MSSDNQSARIHFPDPLKLLPRALCKLYTMWVGVTHPFAYLGKNVSFHYTTDFNNTGLMKIGNFVTVHKDVWLHANPSCAGSTEPVLTIGDHCFIARRSHIHARNGIHLAGHVILADSVLIIDSQHSFADPQLPVRLQGATEGGRILIEEGCWIGHGAAIICDKGELVLGRNCVVGANAVVTKSAPPYSVLSGNPARIVKQYDPDKQDWVLGASRLASLPDLASGER